MNKEIEKVFNEYCRKEEELFDELKKLENYGSECNCDDRTSFTYIHDGNFEEMISVCLNCGGDIV